MSAVKSLLIIDDDEIHNYLISKRVKNIGLSDHVEALTSGQEGLEHLKDKFGENNLPEVIFLDLHMPNMDGWEFLAYFEEMFPENVLSSIKIFLLSSSITPVDIQKAKNHASILEYIKKPLMEDELFILKGRYFS